MNKYQEALDWLSEEIQSVKKAESKQYIETIQELVNKSIPAKVIEEETPPCVLIKKICPSCGKTIINYSYSIPYCEHCGQKLIY